MLSLYCAPILDMYKGKVQYFMKKTITRVNIGCVACALVLVLLLITQFVPFWQEGEMSASIGAYVWFPQDNKAVTTYLQGFLGKAFEVGNMVAGPVVLLVGSLVSLWMCLFMQSKWITPIVTAVTGLAGTIGYLATPALRLGKLWGVHLGLCVLLLAMAAVTIWWKKNTK